MVRTSIISALILPALLAAAGAVAAVEGTEIKNRVNPVTTRPKTEASSELFGLCPPLRPEGTMRRSCNGANVSAVSGENRGATATGDAKAAAKIKTIVNGERVESISIEAKATAGEESEKKVEQRTATSTENGALHIETTVEVKAHAAPSATTTTSQRYRQPTATHEPRAALPTAGAIMRRFEAIGAGSPWSDLFSRLRNFLTHAFRFP